MNWKIHATAAAIAAFSFLPAHAADTAATDASKLSRSEAKVLKAQSEGEYKARKNVAEANQDLAQADCAALKGSAKRACNNEAKATAKAEKAAAKTNHELQEQQIKAAK